MTVTIGSLLKTLGEAYEEREAAEELLNSASEKIESCLQQLSTLGVSLSDAPLPPPEKAPVVSISIGEYAKARGVSVARIQQLLRDQTISASPGGLIDEHEADELILAAIGPGKLRNAILDSQRIGRANGS